MHAHIDCKDACSSAPRAINFYFYPTSKAYIAKQFPNAPTTKPGQTAEDSPVVHLSAAVIAGIMTATGTNPIWGESLRALQYRVQVLMNQSSRPVYSSRHASSKSLPSPLHHRFLALSHHPLPRWAVALLLRPLRNPRSRP